VNRSHLLLALAGTAVMATACKRHALPTTTITVGEHSMLVEVADDGEERARGVMNRDGLGANEGMLFIYPDEKERSFWMKNVRFPLSIAFADKSGKILSISDMQPMSQRGTKSGGPAMYALEVNEGWFREHGVEPGDMLGKLPPPSKH